MGRRVVERSELDALISANLWCSFQLFSAYLIHLFHIICTVFKCILRSVVSITVHKKYILFKNIGKQIYILKFTLPCHALSHRRIYR